MADIQLIDPEEVIKLDQLSRYKEGLRFIYFELVRLNVNLFILDHVLTFPFDLFTLPNRSLFFRMVYENFFYSSLLMITRLSTDQGPDVFTLPRFRNQIRNMIKEKYRDTFDTKLREARFDSATKRLFKKATKLRTQRVAHNLEDFVFKVSEEERVTFGELKSLYATLENLFHMLSFGHGHMMLPMQYSPDVRHPKGVDPRPDIEEILDSTAKGSDILNLPERNPDLWNIQRNRLSEQDIEVLNRYRKKFGLETV